MMFSRALLCAGVLLCGGYTSFADVSAQGFEDNEKALYVLGNVLIKVKEDALEGALDNEIHRIGLELVTAYDLIKNLYLYRYNEDFDISDVVSMLNENEAIEYAEPDYLFYKASPNDPYFSQQWALENIGQNAGLIDADINAKSMWSIATGSDNVVIGVIDSGVNYTHNDLIPNLWRNTLDLPGTGIDEDLNGYVDDVYGINALTGSGNPLDDNGHGSHVSGTIGAKGNNGIGVTGVAQTIRVAGCKFLNASGSGPTSDAIECLQYFGKLKTRLINPVNVIATNNSWSGSSKSQALSDAIWAHHNLGILFIAAAGNDSVNNDVVTSYPANYLLPNVITVAATDNRDRLASFSNYGKKTVHVGAPGVRILSTVLGQNYSYYSGTSMATPHVTGLVGIIKSAFPTMDHLSIKNLVIASGTPIASLTNTTISGRRIRGADVNGRGALTCSNQIVSSRLLPYANTFQIVVGQSILLSALKLNCTQPGGDVVLYSDSLQSIVLRDTGTSGDAVANDGIYSLLWQPTSPGTYPLNFGGTDVVTATVFASQQAPTYKVSSTSYSYEVITGTPLSVEDETVNTVTAPFPIRFANINPGYSTLYVGSNGTISFTDNVNPGYANTPLPTPIANTFLAPFWDDLVPTTADADVYVATVGVAPTRKFVVEWRNIRHYNAAGTVTFQAVFFENSSDVRFNFKDTNFSNVNYNAGRSATVGVQVAGNNAVQYSFNTASVPSLSSLLFRI